MPTYEYACTSCGEHLEVVQSFKDDPLAVCPSCGGALRKVFGSIGVVFKGSGFYKTDSRPASKSDKPDRTDKPDKAATSTDSKVSESKGSKASDSSSSSSGSAVSDTKSAKRSSGSSESAAS
jgi:putative FmdB family regulatory protein